MKIQSVAVIGLGALGTMYAHMFRKNLPKGKAWVIAEKNRADRYRSQGIYYNDEICDFEYVTPEEEKSADLVLFCVKYHQLPQAIEDAKNAVGDNTTILSVLNGVTSEEMLSEAFGGEKVLYCVAQGMAAVKIDNRLNCEKCGILAFGEENNNKIWSGRVKAVAEFFDSIGFPYEVPADMKQRMWGKMMLNTGVNQVTAAFFCSYSGVQVPGRPRQVMFEAMEEVLALANLEGVALTRDDIAYWVDIMDGLNPDGMTSMRQDMLAGRKTEVELFAGTVRDLGKKHSVPTPVNDYLGATPQPKNAENVGAAEENVVN